jgi:hypothetical protein
VLGLVLGPGEVLGVGLVVLGVSVPMPPADEPEDEVPDELSDGMPDEVPEDLLPPEEPVSGAPGVGAWDGDSLIEPLLAPEDVDPPPPRSDDAPELVPELPLMPEPEPPPVMPVHAPSSITQAMGNIHFVISHSRKFQMAVRTVARTERTALLMQRVEAGGE